MKIDEILVTGGSGFIGTHLCKKLLSEGIQVRVLDLKHPLFHHEKLEYFKGDIRDPLILEKAIQGVSGVIHLAAWVSVPLCEQNPTESYDVNVRGTKLVLQSAKKQSLDQKEFPLIFASSAAVYGDVDRPDQKLSENSNISDQLSEYGKQKYEAERLCLEYFSKNLKTMPFRFFNVFGEGQDSSSPYSGVITAFQKNLKEGKDIKIFGDGKNTRDFVDVLDLVEVIYQSLSFTNKWNGMPVNLGTSRSVTISDLANRMKNFFPESRSKVIFDSPRPKDIKFSCADNSKLMNLLEYNFKDFKIALECFLTKK